MNFERTRVLTSPIREERISGLHAACATGTRADFRSVNRGDRTPIDFSVAQIGLWGPERKIPVSP